MRPAPIVLALALALLASLTPLPAAADIGVRFVEGAPKDRFVITNLGRCALVQAEVTLDLRGSVAGLIFDTTGAGAGVEVFQPFELVAGADALQAVPSVADGERTLSLRIDRLPPGAQIAFTIDVDDTLGGREITVSGAEIEGATVRMVSGRASASGRFSRSAEATVTTADRAAVSRSRAAMRFLHFDASESGDGVTTLEAMASTSAAQHAQVMAEVRQVLDWAQRHFPQGPGPVDEGHDWDHDLQLRLDDGPWHEVTLTLTGSPHFVAAFLDAFPAAPG